ncbi:MAG: AAA family ATPase, partial [Phycisphaerae bacterium]|nr:AAA family ATPase [Phycisphaerae bacterium]
MLVMLIGYRGSGKTTVGRRLASDLWYGFCDTDSLIAQRQGKTIAELFRESGEQAFRDIESEVVRECCTLKDHVVALGGGAVIRELNRRLLRQSGAKVFYLRCDPAELIRR